MCVWCVVRHPPPKNAKKLSLTSRLYVSSVTHNIVVPGWYRMIVYRRYDTGVARVLYCKKKQKTNAFRPPFICLRTRTREEKKKR